MFTAMEKSRDINHQQSSHTEKQQIAGTQSNASFSFNQTIQEGEVLVQEFINNAREENIDAQLLQVLNQQNTVHKNDLQTATDIHRKVPSSSVQLDAVNADSGGVSAQDNLENDQPHCVDGKKTSNIIITMQCTLMHDRNIKVKAIMITYQVCWDPTRAKKCSVAAAYLLLQVNSRNVPARKTMHCLLTSTVGLQHLIHSQPVNPTPFQPAPSITGGQGSKPSFASLFASPNYSLQSKHIDLPNPYFKGNLSAIKLDENAYQQALGKSNEHRDPRTKTISKKKGSNSLHSHPNPNPKPTFVATSNSVGDVNGIASSSHVGFNNNACLNNSTTQPPAPTTINVEIPQVLRPNFNATNPQVQSSVGTSLSSPNPSPSFNVEPTLQCLMPLAVSPINCSTSSSQAYPSPSPHHSLLPQSVESFVPNTISDQQCLPISNDNMPIGDEEEEPPIQSFEHSADEQFADTNALCVQLAADSDPSVLNQLTPENFKNTGYLSSLYTDSSPSATYNLHSHSDSEYIPQSPSSTPSSHSPDNFTPTIPLLTNTTSKANKKHARAIQKQKNEMLKLGIPQASIELCFGKETASKPASPTSHNSSSQRRKKFSFKQ
ncbi:hypothetical protein LguiA_006996 [Lonicera macranthoides]